MRKMEISLTKRNDCEGSERDIAAASLPPELWAIIFFWATYTPLRDNDISVPLFRDDNFRQALVASLPTKRNLVRVHSQWRELALPFLYEDIRINRDYRSLADSIENSESCTGGGGVGKFVRRVEIVHDSGLVEEDFQNIVLDILHHCPNVHILSNRSSETQDRVYQFPATLSSLPSLSVRRLDWEISDNTHFVPAFLRDAKNLQIMTLGCHASRPFVLAPMHCPNLHTLILKKFAHLYDAEPCWRFVSLSEFPSLHRLVLEEAPRTILSALLLAKIGQTIRHIEIRPKMIFLRGYDLPAILGTCTNLETLDYAVFFTRALPSFSSETVKEISMHSWINYMYDDDDAWKWEQLRFHFSALTIESFPSLSNVILRGDWDCFLQDARFVNLLFILRSRNIPVRYKDSLV